MDPSLSPSHPHPPNRLFAWGFLVSVLVTAPLMALLYMGDQAAGLPFVPFDLFDWIARTLPGDVITEGIDAMVAFIDRFNLGETSSTAKTLETVAALATFLGAVAVDGAILFVVLGWLATRYDWQGTESTAARLVPGMVGGALVSLPVILISQDVNVNATTSGSTNAVWLVVVFGIWGAAIAWLYDALAQRTPQAEVLPPADARADSHAPSFSTVQLSRRAFLVRVGGATATLTVAGAGLARYLEYREEQDYQRLINRRRAQAAAIANELPNAGDPVEPAPGTRPELTPLEDHYRIDISVRPPELDAESWRLNIGGLVDNPLALSLDDLIENYDPLHQYVTLACISNPVGGDLTSTIQWTGVRLKDVLADAGLHPNAQYAHIRSADGFYETLALSLLDEDDRIMLCYNWEGIPLLHKHGFPLRIYIPDRYGMKQPKWITDIEIMDEFVEGYWVERGWSVVARMRATAVVDIAASDRAFERDGQTYVPVGGIAHAGARGVSRVEVQVDDGEWVEAQLRAPLSETTWVIWRYDWPFSEGQHTFRVRCIESDGTPQIQERAGARPSGATGYHQLSQEI